MTLPENLPPSVKLGMDNFNFSFSMAKNVLTDIDSEYSQLTDRIDNILDSEKFFVANVPVLRSIMALNPSASDLKKLSKALHRLSDLTDRHTELSGKINLIKTVNDNPHWFVSAFGDFSKELDKDIDDFFEQDLSD